MPASAIASSGSGTAGWRTPRSRPDGSLLALLLLAAPLAAQQVPDTAFHPPITHPAHPAGTGPVIAVDEAHHNFHQVAGRYGPFAALLGRDGYRVVSNRATFTPEALAAIQLLVIANPIAAENETAWVVPVLPAFSDAEVRVVRGWVERGGALLLIADHMPFGGAAQSLGRAFGFELANGFAYGEGMSELPPFTREAGTLRPHALTDGSSVEDRVSQVRTFMGQAFRGPPEAEPLLVLPKGSVQLFPDTAWSFSAGTRREDASDLMQGAVLQLGQGRVAIFGEAAMFSAQLAGSDRRPSGMNAPGAEGNVTLLRNLVRWLTERR